MLVELKVFSRIVGASQTICWSVKTVLIISLDPLSLVGDEHMTDSYG
jgi:hypothetical protein